MSRWGDDARSASLDRPRDRGGRDRRSRYRHFHARISVRRRTPDAPPRAPNVPLATARSGDFVERVAAQGRIGPPAGSSAKIAFAQAGIVRVVDVRVGQTVSGGQPLAELDRAALGAAVGAAQADVRDAVGET